MDIPRSVVSGYASFLFPIFANSAALTKTDISNFSAIDGLVSILAGGAIAEAKRRFSLRQVVSAALLGAGVVFVLLGLQGMYKRWKALDKKGVVTYAAI